MATIEQDAIQQVRKMLDDIAEQAENDSPDGGSEFDPTDPEAVPAGLIALGEIIGVSPMTLRKIAVRRVEGELLPSLQEVIRLDPGMLKNPTAVIASAACTSYIDGFIHGAAWVNSEGPEDD